MMKRGDIFIVLCTTFLMTIFGGHGGGPVAILELMLWKIDASLVPMTMLFLIGHLLLVVALFLQNSKRDRLFYIAVLLLVIGCIFTYSLTALFWFTFLSSVPFLVGIAYLMLQRIRKHFKH